MADLRPQAPWRPCQATVSNGVKWCFGHWINQQTTLMLKFNAEFPSHKTIQENLIYL